MSDVTEPKKTSPRVSAELRAKMVELYNGGLSIRAVGREVNRPYATVHNNLRDAGVQFRAKNITKPKKS